MRKENFILIGFMGVGKGTVARALCKATDMFAIDTDDLIESMENEKIKKIFEKKGEPYFRDLEKKCALWLENSVSGSIISTGGGFYRQENIKKIGKIIYLKSSFEGILNRIHTAPNAKAKLKKRPLLKNIDEAKFIYDSRVSDYENVSDIIINVEGRDIEDIINDIKTEVGY